jgi:hypothetical protein
MACSCEEKCPNCECQQKLAAQERDFDIKIIELKPVSKKMNFPADIRITMEPPHITVCGVQGIKHETVRYLRPVPNPEEK